MNISQIHLNPMPYNLFSEQNKKWWIWHVGFSNSSIGLYRLVCLALDIHGVCPFTRSARAKSCWQGSLGMYSTIVLDCQTKTAIPCSQDCIVYKTCTAHKKKC
jgi:hypothetical protein